jgi:hypothetical protein
LFQAQVRIDQGDQEWAGTVVVTAAGFAGRTVSTPRAEWNNARKTPARTAAATNLKEKSVFIVEAVGGLHGRTNTIVPQLFF